MRKKVLLICIPIVAVAVLIFVFFFFGFNQKLSFITGEANYYNPEDFTSQTTPLNDEIVLNIDMETYPDGNDKVFFKKGNYSLALKKIDYIQQDDSYKVFITSQGTASLDGASYISLENFETQLSTYFNGMIKMEYSDKTDVDTEGKCVYELLITHDDKVSSSDFKKLTCPFYFNGIQIVTLTKNQ